MNSRYFPQMEPPHVHTSTTPPVLTPSRWDFVGITASMLCLLHCLAMPFVLLAFPVIERLIPAEHEVHMALGVLVASTGLVAFLIGYREHRRLPLFATAVVGVGAILLGSFGHETLPSHRWAEAITVFGSVVLVTAHLINLRLCRQCRHAH